MEKKKLISFDWKEQVDIDTCLEKSFLFLISVWIIIQNKWPDLFVSTIENRKIIQGAIGYSSFNQVIISLLNDLLFENELDFIQQFNNKIQDISFSSEKWLPGGPFSKYSSESGYKIVCHELITNMNV